MKLDKQGNQEQIPKYGEVYRKGRKWYMRCDAKSPGVELPRHVAVVIRHALSVQQKAEGGDRRLAATIHQITCHQTAFRAMGLTNRNDQDLSYDFPLFTDVQFKKYTSVEECVSGIRDLLKGSVGVAQISSPWRIVHTIIVGFDSLNRCICFEKADTHLPFQIVPLEQIYRSWASSFSWAAGPLSKVMDSEIVKSVRSTIDKYNPPTPAQ